MTTFLDGGSSHFEDGRRVMREKDGHKGTVLSTHSILGQNVCSVLGEDNVVFEAYEDELLGIW